MASTIRGFFANSSQSRQKLGQKSKWTRARSNGPPSAPERSLFRSLSLFLSCVLSMKLEETWRANNPRREKEREVDERGIVTYHYHRKAFVRFTIIDHGRDGKKSREPERDTMAPSREKERERESLRYARLTHLLSSPPPPSQACYVDYRLACFATTIQLRIQMHVQITRLVSRAWKELAKRSVEDVGSSPSFCVFVRGG